MSASSRPPLEVSPADLTALRYLAIAWGVLISATWFVLDDLRTQLLTTGAQLVIMAGSLFSIYLLRQWKTRRRKRAEDQRSRQVPK